MPLETVSELLEESKRGIEWQERHSDFSGGMGLRWAKEYLTDLRSQTGYWFGRLDTFSGMPHLPVKLQTDATFEAYTAETISFGAISITDTDISFNSGTKKIARGANGMGVFAVGDKLFVSGAAESGNNGTFTITVVDGTGADVTVSESLTTEGASATVTLNVYKIADSASGFDDYDYIAGDTIEVSGDSDNNGTYVIGRTITNALITVDSALSTEAEGDSVTIELVPSASKTDYVCFAEFGDTGGNVYLYMAKGTEVWRTQGTAWRRVHTLASAQGRGFYVRETFLIWATGPSADLQYTQDGTTWQDYLNTTTTGSQGAGAAVKARLAWHNTVDAHAAAVALNENYLLRRQVSAGWSSGSYIHLRGSVEPFLIGTTEYWTASEIDTDAWIASGPTVFKSTTAQNSSVVAEYFPGLLDITAGCAYQEELALVDGGQGPYLWSEGKPLRPIPIWREDGCPPDMKGKIKSIAAIGDALIVYWELDAGNSLIFWGRPNAAGQWCWHPRSATLTGEFPLGSGNMGWAHGSLSTKDRRRLWTATADGSTFRLYYQDYPETSWNPLTWTTAQYEAGYLYLYTAWQDLLLMGDEAAALVEMERNAELGATSKLLTVDCRTDYDTVAEESATFPITLLTFIDTTRWQEIASPDGIQALAVQQRIGLNRDSTVTNTPVLYDLGTTVRRQVRHPGLRRK